LGPVANLLKKTRLRSDTWIYKEKPETRVQKPDQSGSTERKRGETRVQKPDQSGSTERKRGETRVTRVQKPDQSGSTERKRGETRQLRVEWFLPNETRQECMLKVKR
jgi:hypothetical protein